MTSQQFRERLARRAQAGHVNVTREVVARLEAYYQLLSHWNAKINLTALPLAEPTDDTFDRLLIEPLSASRFLPDASVVWFDLGSGGGSPAIPLKILRTHAKLILVESRARKAAFLREAVRHLDLPDVHVEHARIEEIASEVPQSGHIVTVRAVKADPALFKAAANLLVAKGRLLWFRSERTPLKPPRGFRHMETATLIDQKPAEVAVLQRVFHVEQTD